MNQIFEGNAKEKLQQIDTASVQCVVTSPPYWNLRDYKHDEQLGLEKNPLDYVENLCLIFDEVWKVLKDDGTVFVNIGDTYSRSDYPDLGIKPKDLVGIPWRFAFAMQKRGWYLRQDIIWAKPNPMPEPAKDRCTRSHENIFMFTKSAKYFYDFEAIREPRVTTTENHQFGGKKYNDPNNKVMGGIGSFYKSDGKRNKRDVWFIAPQPFKGAHFAVMPESVVEPCLLAGSKPGDVVLDPFFGSGTVGVVALKNQRNFVGIELNPDYVDIACKRIDAVVQQTELEITSSARKGE